MTRDDDSRPAAKVKGFALRQVVTIICILGGLAVLSVCAALNRVVDLRDSQVSGTRLTVAQNAPKSTATPTSTFFAVTGLELPPTSTPTLAPVPSREYSERRADGSVWLVRQWSDGRYEDLRQVTAAWTVTMSPVPTATPTRVLTATPTFTPNPPQDIYGVRIDAPTGKVDQHWLVVPKGQYSTATAVARSLIRVH